MAVRNNLNTFSEELLLEMYNYIIYTYLAVAGRVLLIAASFPLSLRLTPPLYAALWSISAASRYTPLYD
jgi:hypothetical protein